MDKVGVLVKIDVMPGALEKLRRFFKDYHPRVLKDKGLLYNHVLVDRDDPSKVYVFECWESQQDYENHLDSAHTKKFVEDIQGTYGPEGYIKTLTPLF